MTKSNPKNRIFTPAQAQEVTAKRAYRPAAKKVSFKKRSPQASSNKVVPLTFADIDGLATAFANRVASQMPGVGIYPRSQMEDKAIRDTESIVKSSLMSPTKQKTPYDLIDNLFITCECLSSVLKELEAKLSPIYITAVADDSMATGSSESPPSETTLNQRLSDLNSYINVLVRTASSIHSNIVL